MKKVPCEVAVWELLPTIRRMLAITLIKEHALNQRDTARILGLTEAAVSQYISSKRGGRIELSDEIMAEIKKSAGVIIQDETKASNELCRICTLMQRYRASAQNKVLGDNLLKPKRILT